jgi:U3 small nucleolar RNA-associated protein 6
LAVKGNDPSLWILAAKWEFEENHSVSNARSLLLRALRFHPNNMQVYTEAFRLELLEADRLRKRRAVLGLSCEADLPDQQEKRDEILDGKLAVLFYEDSKKVVKSASELVPFLTVSKDFDFTREIQKSIFE